jgi:peptide methionine sulfoxide reductase MsrB
LELTDLLVTNGLDLSENFRTEVGGENKVINETDKGGYKCRDRGSRLFR